MRRKTRRKNRNHLAKGRTGRWTENLITPGTHWCGPGNTARRYSDLGPTSSAADRCCRDHDRCSRYILGLSRSHAHTNFNPFTLSHCTCDRSLRLGRPDQTPLRLPGTMWCGRGYSATSYKQLGAFSAADRCCRRHDTACPRYVPAMSFRWGIYNWRPSTLMHCHCDRSRAPAGAVPLRPYVLELVESALKIPCGEGGTGRGLFDLRGVTLLLKGCLSEPFRFRTCLKMAGTTASHFVGKLFFNLVQSKCFVLKTERICTKRNWWGKCQKTELQKIAHLRSNMPF